MRISLIKGQEENVEKAPYYEAYCDGVKLEYCEMADEAKGIAAVFDVEDKRLVTNRRMVYGKIELRKK